MAVREIVYDYTDAQTLLRFSNDRTNTRVLMGPFGSGKSSACVMEILQIGREQEPDSTGWSRTRWAVVRNTYRMLTDTTMKTFFDWLPPDVCGVHKITDHQYIINRLPALNGNPMEIEVLFRALDRPDHVRNLLSMEVTGAWFNELREIPKAIWDAMDGRVGRYPSMKDVGPSWHGIIADTNPPDTDSWIYKLFEEQVITDPRIANKFRMFKQPSGLSSEAENTKYLRKDYYTDMCIGKSPDYIKVYVEGEYGYVRDGKPVWGNYTDGLHLSEEPILPVRGIPIIVSFDFGLTPAAIFCQQHSNGRFTVFDELCGQDMGLKRFVRDVVRPHLFANYGGLPIIATGDPAGVRRSETDEVTAYMILRDCGINAKPARTNSFLARFNAVDSLLMKLVGGKAAFQLDKRCKVLHKGFLGEYKFRRLKVTGDDRYVDSPDKNEFSHPHDALQYAAMLAESGFDQLRSLFAGGSQYSNRRPATPISTWY